MPKRRNSIQRGAHADGPQVNVEAHLLAQPEKSSLGTRATAAKDAVGDKVDESKHSVCDPVHLHFAQTTSTDSSKASGEANKQKATH